MGLNNVMRRCPYFGPGAMSTKVNSSANPGAGLRVNVKDGMEVGGMKTYHPLRNRRPHDARCARQFAVECGDEVGMQSPTRSH